MKQDFLDSLKGLSWREAVVAVHSAGHEPYVIENGDAIAAVAMPNTVVLWLDSNDMVDTATAGDPVELR